jgi:phage-related protein
MTPPSRCADGNAAAIFCIAQGRMALLHGFVKQTQRIPNDDLALARRRMKEIEQ